MSNSGVEPTRNAKQLLASTDQVRVSAYKPFSRWAVGPRDPSINAAIPFYTLRGAAEFYAEIERELPPPTFDPPVLYRKRWFRRIEEVPHGR